MGSCDDGAVVTGVPVAGRRFPLEHSSQSRDERLNALRRARRRLLVPELVDDPIDRDNLVRVQQEKREQGALLTPPERQLAIAVAHLERTEDPKVQFQAPVRSLEPNTGISRRIHRGRSHPATGSPSIAAARQPRERIVCGETSNYRQEQA